MNKKILAVSLAVCLLVALGAGLTLAYLTDTKTAENTFTVGSVAIELTEPKWADGSDEGNYPREAQFVYPGEKLDKDPTITNTGNNPCLVRVKVDIPTFGDSRTPYAVIEGLHADWKLHTDGYYYYLKPLAAGATAPAVFTAVRFSTAITNGVSGGSIDVTAYAVQAQGAISGSYSQIEDGIDPTTELPTVAAFFNTAFTTT